MASEMVKLGRVFEKISARGNSYMVGRLGAARLLLFKDRDNDGCWNLFLQNVDDDGGGNQQRQRRQQQPDDRTRRADELNAAASKLAAGQQQRRPDDRAPLPDDRLDDLYPPDPAP